mgnify:CR=1 FL=1
MSEKRFAVLRVKVKLEDLLSQAGPGKNASNYFCFAHKHTQEEAQERLNDIAWLAEVAEAVEVLQTQLHALAAHQAEMQARAEERIAALEADNRTLRQRCDWLAGELAHQTERQESLARGLIAEMKRLAVVADAAHQAAQAGLLAVSSLEKEVVGWGQP